jgi:hypothetical protein
MLGKWDAWYANLTKKDEGAFRYGDTETYALAAGFLHDVDVVEDWGCGLAGFRRFYHGTYLGVDGSHTPCADVIADLVTYTSYVAGIVMRHVLEHNYEWERVLDNAVQSFRDKLCVILFTPLQVGPTIEIAHNRDHGVDVPDLAFNREQLEKHLVGLKYHHTVLKTNTGYGEETIYYIEREHD